MAIKIASLDTHADGTLVVPNKLGIGTSSPDSYNSYGNNLVVKNTTSTGITIASGSVDYGSIHFADGTTGADAYRGQIVYNHTTNVLSFSTDASERMRINSSGNVGIGTSSPGNLLTLGGTEFAGIAFQSPTYPSNGTYVGLDGIGNFAINNRENKAITISTNNTERMRITSSGNVGIGTSSPAVRLHVADNVSGGLARGILENTASSGFTDLLIKSLGATTYSSLSMAGNYNYIFFIDGAQSTERARITSDSTGNLGFATGASATERMRITSSGNVGIGTSSPSETLHLYYSTGDNFYAVDSGNATSYSGIKFLSQGSQKWKLANSGSTTSHSMYILDADNSHGVYLSQNTQSWAAASDSRLKDVQGTITNALDKVQQLTGVKFKWKRESDNPDAKVRVGLIAQDVQEVLPEAVDDESPELITDEETGRVSGGLGVRYTEVIPLLVNAIKELTARVVTLEQAVA